MKIDNNKFTEGLDALTSLTALNSLHANNNDFTGVTDFVGDFSDLQMLFLNGNAWECEVYDYSGLAGTKFLKIALILLLHKRKIMQKQEILVVMISFEIMVLCF